MTNKVIKNASWIIGCKIAQSVLSFIIGLFTARYLGPSNFGLVTYASSTASFFLPIMRLGLNSILVQEILDNPSEEGKIIGTSLVLNGLSAICSIVGVVAFAYIANPNEPETILVCFLYSLMLFFQAGEMIQYWFQSKLLSKYPSIVSLIAYLIISIYKIYILITAKNINWFALTHVLETAIISIFLLIIYKRIGGQKLKFSSKMGKRLFSKSKYYISSGLIMVLIQQTDRVMLKMMVGQTQIGFYSAAFTCVGITGFIFMAIIDSMRPYIISAKNESRIVFEERLTNLFTIITFLSLSQGIVMTIFSKLLILVLFGQAYEPAIVVLQILSWQVIFGYYGNARNIWILVEGKQKYLWRINLFGVIFNVIGNAILIPVMGACGAALISVVTQILINFILCLIIKPIKPVGRIIIKSWNPILVISFIKKTILKLKK